VSRPTFNSPTFGAVPSTRIIRYDTTCRGDEVRRVEW